MNEIRWKKTDFGDMACLNDFLPEGTETILLAVVTSHAIPLQVLLPHQVYRGNLKKHLAAHPDAKCFAIYPMRSSIATEISLSDLQTDVIAETKTRNGEASYETIGQQIGQMVDTKQAAYGNSFGRAGNVLRELYPNGISREQIDDALCVVRIVDKLFRIATDKDALGESPYRDIAGYGMLGAYSRR